MDINEKEIKNLEYFKGEIIELIKHFEKKGILTIDDRETKEKLEKIIVDLNTHIEKDKNDIIYAYKVPFVTIISELAEEIEFNKRQVKPIKTDFKPYNEKTYSKLNYIFRKENKGTLNDKQAKDKYSDFKLLKDKYDVFLELINWLNDNKLSIIPEKTLFCAFLGISVDTYNNMLKSAKNEEVRNLFSNIDEYFITNQFGALINDDRKSLERLQKLEKYSPEIKTIQSDMISNFTQNNVIQSYADLRQMLDLKNKKTYGKDNIIEYKEE